MRAAEEANSNVVDGMPDDKIAQAAREIIERYRNQQNVLDLPEAVEMTDPIAVGLQIIEHALSLNPNSTTQVDPAQALNARFAEDPEGFFPSVALNGHTLKFVVNTDKVTHVVIPSEAVIARMVLQAWGCWSEAEGEPISVGSNRVAVGERYRFPPQYHVYPEDDPATREKFIDAKLTPEKAYKFRVGDYTFAQCG